MKIKRNVLLLSLIVLTTFSCSSVKVYSDQDKDTDIKNYTTFQWDDYTAIEKKGVNPLYYNELNDARIKAAVDNQLATRGFTKVSTGGELVLHYHIILESKATPITLDPDNHEYSSAWTRRNVEVYQYTEGTLIIDLMDETKNRIVWRGWIVGVVDAANLVDSEEAINNAVELIFKKFPH